VIEVDEIYQTYGMKKQKKGSVGKDWEGIPEGRGKRKAEDERHYDKKTPIITAPV